MPQLSPHAHARASPLKSSASTAARRWERAPSSVGNAEKHRVELGQDACSSLSLDSNRLLGLHEPEVLVSSRNTRDAIQKPHDEKTDGRATT
jgi:hypothetical protein